MKGVVAVIVSVLWFRNPISLYGMLGYGVTVAGVIAYSQVDACSSPVMPHPQAPRKHRTRSVAVQY